MGKKGFTLVELLAVLIILGIIMAIAIPSTVSILDNNKKKTYISDAKRFATMAELEYKKNGCLNGSGSDSSCTLYLSKVNDGTLDEDPDGGKYSLDQSYVLVEEKSSGGYYVMEYSVYLKGENRYVGTSSKSAIKIDSNLTTSDVYVN